jgi:DHA2 family multidrug resistance protein
MNRTAITISIMLSVIMRGLDNTIANVALAHIQGSLSVSREQVAWVLTSYIISTAIAMPLSGWLAGRLGIKYVFLVSVVIFAGSSALCGAATSLEQLVLYRILQGWGSAALVPLSQATLLQINPPERHGQAMAVFGTGTILGPIAGPALGGWLTDMLSWRWVFYVNVPIAIISAVGIAVFMRESRHAHREQFDFIGFATLSVAIGAFQLMLDRGEVKDWFSSTEICVEATLAALALYLLVVHTSTTTGRSFLSRELLKNPAFVAGTVLVFFIGITMNGTLALLPLMLQESMNYPVLTTGLMMMPRGIGRR